MRIMAKRPSGPGKPPDRAGLQAAALNHLARYAATEIGLKRVLHRKIDRWAREADGSKEGEREEIAQIVAKARHEAARIVARLAESGAVSDQAFAEGRARSLSRAGRSRRAIGVHLAERGVGQELAASVLPQDPAREVAAALIHARKRRLGPFRKLEETPELRRRELANMARAGFDHATASRVLRMAPHEAEERIIASRSSD